MPCQPSHSGFVFVTNNNASDVPSPDDASGLEGVLACGVGVALLSCGLVVMWCGYSRRLHAFLTVNFIPAITSMLECNT